jgi:hypothetical protein
MIMMESGSQETLDSEITNLYSVQRRVRIRVIRVFTDSSTKDNTVTGRELPVVRVLLNDHHDRVEYLVQVSLIIHWVFANGYSSSS